MDLLVAAECAAEGPPASSRRAARGRPTPGLCAGAADADEAAGPPEDTAAAVAAVPLGRRLLRRLPLDCEALVLAQLLQMASLRELTAVFPAVSRAWRAVFTSEALAERACRVRYGPAAPPLRGASGPSAGPGAGPAAEPGASAGSAGSRRGVGAAAAATGVVGHARGPCWRWLRSAAARECAECGPPPLGPSGELAPRQVVSRPAEMTPDTAGAAVAGARRAGGGARREPPRAPAAAPLLLLRPRLLLCRGCASLPAYRRVSLSALKNDYRLTDEEVARLSPVPALTLEGGSSRAPPGPVYRLRDVLELLDACRRAQEAAEEASLRTQQRAGRATPAARRRAAAAAGEPDGAYISRAGGGAGLGGRKAAEALPASGPARKRPASTAAAQVATAAMPPELRPELSTRAILEAVRRAIATVGGSSAGGSGAGGSRAPPGARVADVGAAFREDTGVAFRSLGQGGLQEYLHRMQGAPGAGFELQRDAEGFGGRVRLRARAPRG